LRWQQTNQHLSADEQCGPAATIGVQQIICAQVRAELAHIGRAALTCALELQRTLK